MSDRSVAEALDQSLPPTPLPAPLVRDFAILGGLESCVRAALTSVWPLAMYQALGSAGTVSWVYFVLGILALLFGFGVPGLGRVVPRRWLFTAGAALNMLAAGLAILGGPVLTPLALLAMNCGTVTLQICVNAYVMDHIAREDLGKSESMRLFYSAAPWVLGPVAGVWMWKIWVPLPYLAAMGAAAAMLGFFWHLRLSNGKSIARAGGAAPNPLAYLGRFIRQPRLVAGWLFAVLRSAGWWVFIVYLPIFCVEYGLDDRIGSYAFAASNLMLFLTPLMLKWMQRVTLRVAVRVAFGAAALCFLIASMGWVWPPLAVVAVFTGAVFLTMLDTFGSLPFLMAVRPAERTEMSAVYASFRNFSGIVAPGVAWVVLLVAPVPAVFAAAAGGLGVAWAIAARLHPRLGARR